MEGGTGQGFPLHVKAKNRGQVFSLNLYYGRKIPLQKNNEAPKQESMWSSDSMCGTEDKCNSCLVKWEVRRPDWLEQVSWWRQGLIRPLRIWMGRKRWVDISCPKEAVPVLWGDLSLCIRKPGKSRHDNMETSTMAWRLMMSSLRNINWGLWRFGERCN